MEKILLIIGVIITAGLIYTIILVTKLLKKKPIEQKQDETGLKLIMQRLGELSQNQSHLTEKVGETLRDSSHKLHESLKFQTSESLKAIRNVTERLTKLDETNKQVVSFADQLKNLQDILKNPKQRGILGEYYLETTLKNVMPPKTYQMQYTFPDGSIVDAVVFVKERIIPVDSKFSLENYNRLSEAKDPSEVARLEKDFKSDLKKRIDETAKYIQPSNGTMDFAFMFIPHEAIYYDLLVNEIGAVKVNTQDLIEYAFKRNVLIVSPTSFLAFLQTVLQGLKALEIEESAKEIQKRVGELGTHIKAYETYHEKLGTSLGTVVNHYNRTTKELKKVDKDVFRITGDKVGIAGELDVIGKPEKDE